ncbi:hypothetical protein LOTGIDRAFT_162861 [Lottia gigantea]|uniref:CUB domain-containing protein n=1 Tax=Lottia gigantea TaxID=225164 RepID=V4AAS3_LOTGI|nr:hypothetical protein LOTGIDRAFT_162861 [Lottia gigantea]ESO92205.1 hypothetical protein LOTGIDRAFT_162861 [Lottia gigantea]
METEIFVAVFGFVIFSVNSASQVPSTYTIKSSSVCYGSDPECTRHFLSCDKKTSVIGLFQGVYGFKPLGSMCRDVSACRTVDPETCCTKQKDDCGVVFRPGDLNQLYSNCSGRPQCSFDAPRLTAKCSTQTYRSISVFSDVKYTCVKENQLVTLGDRKTIVGDQVYVIYRDKILSKMADVVDCQCLVLSRNGSKVDIDIFALDIRLNKTIEPGCSTVSFIKDGEVLREMSCSSRKFYHSFEYILRTSTPLRAKVTLNKKTKPTNIWFGFRGLNGEVTLSCSYVSQVIEPETSTSPTTVPKNIETTSSHPAGQHLDRLVSSISSTRMVYTQPVSGTTSPTVGDTDAISTTTFTDSSTRNESRSNGHSSSIFTPPTDVSSDFTSVTIVRQTIDINASVSNTEQFYDVTSTFDDVNTTSSDAILNSDFNTKYTESSDVSGKNDNENTEYNDVHTKSENAEIEQDKKIESEQDGSIFQDSRIMMAGGLFGGCVVLIVFISALYCYVRRRTKREAEMSEIFQIEDGDKSADHVYHVKDPDNFRHSSIHSNIQSTLSESSTDPQCLYSQIDDVRRHSEIVYAIPNKKRTVHSLNSVTKVNSTSSQTPLANRTSLNSTSSNPTSHNDYFDLEAETFSTETSDVMSETLSDDGYNHLNEHQSTAVEQQNDYDSLTPPDSKSTNL